MRPAALSVTLLLHLTTVAARPKSVNESDLTISPKNREEPKNRTIRWARGSCNGLPLDYNKDA